MRLFGLSHVNYKVIRLSLLGTLRTLRTLRTLLSQTWLCIMTEIYRHFGERVFKFLLDNTTSSSNSDWLWDGRLKNLKLEAEGSVLHLVQNSSVISPAVDNGVPFSEGQAAKT